MQRQPGRRVARDLEARLERRHDHPVDGEHHHDEDGGPGQVEGRRVRRVIAPRRPHHLPDVEERHRQHQQEHHERDRRAEAVLADPERLLVGVDAHQVVLGIRALEPQQERLREDLEVPDDREAGQDHEDRLQDREDDVAEARPRAGAVDRRRLEQLARHLRQPRVDRDRDEGDRAPDDQRRDHGEALERAREPVVLDEVAEAELRQRVVQDAVLVLGHPEPYLSGDDDRHRPCQHERRRDERAHHAAELREQERNERAEAHREADVDGGEDHRPENHVPELAVAEDRRVVVKTDPLALVRDQLEEAVVLERQPDQVVERVSEHGRHDHSGRRDQRVRRRAVQEAVAREAPPPRRLEGRRGDSGGEGRRLRHPAARVMRSR